MPALEKNCLQCAKKIVGRTDKKFCDNYCRSSYHNEQTGKSSNYIRQINHLLQKNRRILAATYSQYPARQPIPLHELLLMGFNALHFTHQQKDQRAGTYTFCYDYGYKMIGRNAVKIVQQTST
jgi:hypothetical protein